MQIRRASPARDRVAGELRPRRRPARPQADRAGSEARPSRLAGGGPAPLVQRPPENLQQGGVGRALRAQAAPPLVRVGVCRPRDQPAHLFGLERLAGRRDRADDRRAAGRRLLRNPQDLAAHVPEPPALRDQMQIRRASPARDRVAGERRHRVGPARPQARRTAPALDVQAVPAPAPPVPEGVLQRGRQLAVRRAPRPPRRQLARVRQRLEEHLPDLVLAECLPGLRDDGPPPGLGGPHQACPGCGAKPAAPSGRPPARKTSIGW